jgi:hypothetical protein
MGRPGTRVGAAINLGGQLGRWSAEFAGTGFGASLTIVGDEDQWWDDLLSSILADEWPFSDRTHQVLL